MDAFRARLWYEYVRRCSGNASDYALERRFAPTPGSDWICTGAFRQYRRGRVPNERVVARVEEIYPKSRLWLELPFFEMCHTTAPSYARLHQLLSSIRDDITALLFFKHREGLPLQRRTDNTKIYSKLDRASDIESLTAAIGLIREAEYHESEIHHYRASVTALRIFLRLAIFFPLADVAYLLGDYLIDRFFSTTYDLPRTGPISSGLNFADEFFVRNDVILMLEDLDVLECKTSIHRACLYLADLYGLGKAHYELEQASKLGTEDAKITSVVRWFVSHLMTHPVTASCVD